MYDLSAASWPTASRRRADAQRAGGLLLPVCRLLADGGGDRDEAAEILLQRSLVGTVPGEAFYLDPPGLPYVRVCFSLPDEVLTGAVDRLVEARLTGG